MARRRKGRADTDRRIFAFLFMVLAVKLAVVWQLDAHVLLRPDATIDSQTYVTLAARVMSGDLGLGPDVYYVSPLYIYFYALVMKIFGSIAAVRVVQVALGTLSVGLIVATAREWFGERAAWIAGAAAALTGLLTFYEVTILQSAIDGVLTTTALWALTWALKRGTRAWWLATGVVFAAATLSRPNMIMPAAAIVLVLLLQRRWRGALLLTAGLAIGLAPVAARNVVVAHQFALMSSQGGLAFLTGNGEGATGLFRPLPGIRPTVEGQAEDSRRIAEAALGRQLSNAEVSRYWSGVAWTWIRTHPGTWLRLLATKTYYLFNAQHIALPLSYPFFAYDAGTLLRFLAVGPWLLIPLGLVGLVWPVWLFRDAERRDYLVWMTFVPVYAASVTLFIVSERYRIPLLIPLAVGSGAAGDLIWSAARARSFRALAAASSGVLALSVLANWPLHLVDGDGRGEERVRMAENVARFGNAADAERWANLALERYPNPALLHYRVGVQLTNSGNFAPAVRHLSAALALDPTAGPVEFALAQTLDASGRCADAVPHYRRALELGINENAAEAQRAIAACRQ